MNVSAAVLRQFPLFGHIRTEDIPAVLKCLGAREKEYRKGQFLSFSGDDIRYAGLVLEGSIHMVKEDLWGNKSIFSVMGPGAFPDAG
ncbi:hypothetical protein [Breznakiella homolactica]|uniref:Crp/Fnr family transcriptional regulator n=1 Tax=Breznakiella homolactica TaxID=2798577 RepID=A0A7T7XM31_9SPIR|nr:hypothetical protein [Breznakiella homolactica]QQO08879.1 hypothetical protein JFL75_18410 [Breznakiella homolactica]